MCQEDFQEEEPEPAIPVALSTKHSCYCLPLQFLVPLTLVHCSFGVPWPVRKFLFWWTLAAVIHLSAHPWLARFLVLFLYYLQFRSRLQMVEL